MDCTFTTAQQDLRETTRRYLARSVPLESETAERSPADLWAEAAALGWFDPELTVLDAAVIAEEAGYALTPVPWLGTALAAAALPGPYAAPATVAWAEPDGGAGVLAEVMDGTRAVAADDGLLTGHKVLVPDGASAATALVPARCAAGVALYRVDLRARAGVVRATAGLDHRRSVAELVLAATPATLVTEPAFTAAAMHRVRLRALTLTAAEAVGVGRRALATAVEHARTRVQFGRPVGVNQAIAHRAADVHTGLEMAASLAYRAAWCVTAGDPRATTAAIAATVAARAAAVDATEALIQTLGATGFTWAHPAHRLYRRALTLAAFDGTARRHRAELAGALLDATD